MCDQTSPPFATVEDLERRWHALTETERDKALTLLGDASDIIVTTCPSWATAAHETLTRITCQMVKRAMIAESANPTGMSQYSQTAGSFTESGTYANPTGDLYLLTAEKQALRGGAATAFHITLTAGDDDA